MVERIGFGSSTGPLQGRTPGDRARPRWQAPVRSSEGGTGVRGAAAGRGGARGGARVPSGGARRAARAAAMVAVWLATTSGLGALTGSSAGAVNAPGPARVEDAVVLVAGGAGLVVSWWLAVAVLASVGAALLARRRPDGLLSRAASGVARRTAPAPLRRAAVLAVGLSLTGMGGSALAAVPRPAVAASAGAVPGWCSAPGTHRASAVATAAECLDPAWGGTTSPAAAAARRDGAQLDGAQLDGAQLDGAQLDGAQLDGAQLDGAQLDGAQLDGAPVAASLDPGWVPAPPPAEPVGSRVAATRMPGPAPRARHVARSEVVVRRGDSLWTIVERQLGPSATGAEVAAEWPRWYAANRDVIGPDPDVLQPGQVLRPPAAAAGGTRGRVRPPAPTSGHDRVGAR